MTESMNNASIRHSVVIVKDLDAYQDQMSDILQLSRQITKPMFEPPTSEKVIERIRAATKAGTVFFVHRQIDIHAMRVVGIAILNTLQTMRDPLGFVSDFTILEDQSLKTTFDLHQQLTEAIIDHARSSGMVELIYVGNARNLNNPHSKLHHSRNISDFHTFDLIE